MDRKMKNVLLLCDSFPPAFNPRMGYLCKYLPELGWKPIIVTEYSPQNIYANLHENQDITRINYYWSKSKVWQRLKYIFVFLADYLFNYKDMIISKKAKKIIKTKHIDVILVNSFRTFPALSAKRLSQKFNIPLIVDLRDIFEQSSNNEPISKRLSNSMFINNLIANRIRKKLLQQRNKILKKADAVTTVSEWHVKTLSKYNHNVKLIYNGFDADLFFYQTIKNEIFTIVFTGKVQSVEIKNPSLLFEAISHLSTEKKVDMTNIRLQFYLIDEKSKEIIRSFAQKYHVVDFVDIFDTVPSTEIPKILNSSSILLLLANSSIGENAPKGMMGTKIFEYLAVEKPILCVRNDEDCLEKTIKLANAGLAASDVEEVKEFILEKFAQWQKNGYTQQSVNKEFIQQFSRKRQAEQFADLLTQLSASC
jgi:glycosyltransferase involved in cell wall biosynthesis